MPVENKLQCEIVRYLPEGVEEPKTVLEALTLGRDLLAQEGRWVKGTMYKIENPDEDPSTPFCDSWMVCSVGALWVATIGMAHESREIWDNTLGEYVQVIRWTEAGSHSYHKNDDDEGYFQREALYNETVQRLDEAAKKFDKNAPGIVGYNDDDDRTHEEILAVWDKAIEIERGRAVTVVKNGRFFYRPNGDEPESVSEALTLARQMIEDEGHWTTGVDFKNPGYKDDLSTPFCNGWGACARGAVVAVTLGVYDSGGGYPNDFRIWRAPAEEVPHYSVDPSYGLRYLAHRALKYLDRAASKAGHAGGIVSLNDKSGTKHALVLECFDTAIALAKADEDKVTAPSEA